jgi:hypothetical protein
VYNRQTSEGNFAVSKVRKSLFLRHKKKAVKFFTIQNDDRALLEIIKPGISRLSSFSCELNISQLNNCGELQRPTQIILFCGTKPSPTNSKILPGKNSTKTQHWEGFFTEENYSLIQVTVR